MGAEGMSDHPTMAGILGTVTSLSGVLVSMLPHLETGLRIGGAFVGLIAGLLTCVYMWKKIDKL
jgi:flagellar motor component MotA